MLVNATNTSLQFQGSQKPMGQQLKAHLIEKGLQEDQITGYGGTGKLNVMVRDEAARDQVAAVLKDPNDASGQKLVFKNRPVEVIVTGPFLLFAKPATKPQ